jgi:hypothetical protein
MTTTTEAAIWERVLAVDSELTPEAAAFLLRLDFRETDHARLHELAVKAQDGTLTPEERGEYQEYLRVGNVLAILQSKARVALRGAGANGHG